MPTDHDLDQLSGFRFGPHAQLGMVLYCSHIDCTTLETRWMARVMELDTLRDYVRLAHEHLAERHPVDAGARSGCDRADRCVGDPACPFSMDSEACAAEVERESREGHGRG